MLYSYFGLRVFRMDQSHDNLDTSQRILEAAGELFAEKGFRGTTVSMICQKARANIAAVNYHFDSKENLYQQAWKHAHDSMDQRIQPGSFLSPDRPPAERLRGFIGAALQRSMQGDAIAWRIMRNEMANPTGLLHHVIRDAIRPIREMVQQIIRELLGPGATTLDVELCEVCVVSPQMHILHRRQVEKHEGLASLFREDMIDQMADHFTAYALAGIEQIRNRTAVPKTNNATMNDER